MTNDHQDTPTAAELRAAAYFDRAYQMAIDDGLSPTAAFRVLVLHMLSKVADVIGSDDPEALAGWMEAQAAVIRSGDHLRIVPPGETVN